MMPWLGVNQDNDDIVLKLSKALVANRIVARSQSESAKGFFGTK
jgi:hypothetical protein